MFISWPLNAIPPRPIAAAISVLLRHDHVLLVKRKNPPDARMWGFPGGKIEFGERVYEAALRELYEECRVEAEVTRILTTIDLFERTTDGTVAQHFLLVAVICQWTGGEPVSGDDALDARWVHMNDIENNNLELAYGVKDLIGLALNVSDS